MKRHERSLARRCALQVLYQSEILNKPADQVVEEGLVPEDAGMGDYARMLIMGVSSHAVELDRAIGASSKNWAIDRMPVVDRSLLRLAVFEMKYVDDVPISVSINEAVELAKEFGGEDDSHRFVNGILGRIARDDEASAAAASAAVAALAAEVAEAQAESEAAVDVADEADADLDADADVDETESREAGAVE